MLILPITIIMGALSCLAAAGKANPPYIPVTQEPPMDGSAYPFDFKQTPPDPRAAKAPGPEIVDMFGHITKHCFDDISGANHPDQKQAGKELYYTELGVVVRCTNNGEWIFTNAAEFKGKWAEEQKKHPEYPYFERTIEKANNVIAGKRAASFRG